MVALYTANAGKEVGRSCHKSGAMDVGDTLTKISVPHQLSPSYLHLSRTHYIKRNKKQRIPEPLYLNPSVELKKGRNRVLTLVFYLCLILSFP